MMARAKKTLGYRTWQLSQSFLVVAGVRTAVYRNQHQASRPTWLLVHGIGGDYRGLLPLSYELQYAVNIVIVELPGHGLSAIPADTSIEWLGEWSVDVTRVLLKEKIIINRIIAHSFGCIPATMMLEKYNGSLVFMNVVASPAWFYSMYAYVISYFRTILAHCINFTPFAFLRGIWLLRFYNRETISIVYWLAKHTVCSSAQARYQMDLSNQIGRFDILAQERLKRVKQLEILCGKQDNFSVISPNRLRRYVLNAKLTIHEGGHLLPIERAAYIAKILLK